MKIQYITNIILFLGIFNYSAYAQWNTNSQINNSITNQPNDQKAVNMVTDSKHGAIIGWLDFRRDTTRGDIYAQRIDAQGYNKWSTNGAIICNNDSNQAAMSMIEDGFGGAIFAWNDWRSGNRDIYAQRIDSNGTLLWTSSGQAVAVKPFHQKTPKLIPDGNGGAFITWIDSSNVSWDIYAQHINASGTNLWANSGVPICTATGTQTNPRIETDNNGGAIIVWQDKRNGADYDMYAQRINSAGTIQWATNGIIVCSTIGTQSGQKIRSDMQGGAYIVWQDKRNGIDYNIYAQRISPTGSRMWSANGILICNATGLQNSIDITNENIMNGLIISWKDERKGTKNADIYAQKIDISGIIQWPVNGTAISSAIFNQQNPNTCGDGTGGAIISYQDSSSGTWDIRCQRIDSIGNIRWQTGGAVLSNATYSQTTPINISDNLGGTIAAWQDKRNTIEWDVFASHYNPNWIHAGISTKTHEPWAAATIFPNPATNQVNISLKQIPLTSKEKMSIDISDIHGNCMYKTTSEKNDFFKINTTEFVNGLYFYKIYTKDTFLDCGKFVVQK